VISEFSTHSLHLLIETVLCWASSRIACDVKASNFLMATLKQPEVSALVRELRRRLGLTQEEMAHRVGVSFCTLNRWENQRVAPTFLALQRIEAMVDELGTEGQDLLEQYFSKSRAGEQHGKSTTGS
jgi:putative transcriptional regulator